MDATATDEARRADATVRPIDRDAAVEEIALRVKRFSVESFMDAWTLNIERLQQCCVHVGSTDGEANPVRIPFCARQLFGGLRRTTSAGMVPARELVMLDDVRGRGAAAGAGLKARP